MADPLEADLAVVNTLDPSMRSYIQTGGRLLLLADHAEALKSGGVGFPELTLALKDHVYYMKGDWISCFSWIKRSGPFSELPGGPLVDRSPSCCQPRYVFEGISPWEYEAHVYAGVFIGWLIHPTVIVGERRYGKGKFIFSTFRVLAEPAQGDPAAIALLDALIQWGLK